MNFSQSRSSERIYTFGGDYERKPDYDWRYTGKCGALHKYEEMGQVANAHQVTYTEMWDDGDGRYDEITDTHWECNRCHERLALGTTNIYTGPKFISGPWEYFIDNEQVTKDEFDNRRAEAIRSAQAKVSNKRSWNPLRFLGGRQDGS